MPPHAVEQGGGREDLDIGPTEFRRVAALDRAAKLLAQGLLAIADGEDRNAALEDLHRRAGTARLRNRRRPAGQDHRLRLQPRERFGRLRERVDFAIDPRLAHTAGDQLRDLRAEVDDEDEVVAHAAHLAKDSGWRNRLLSGPDQRRAAYLRFRNQGASPAASRYELIRLNASKR